MSAPEPAPARPGRSRTAATAPTPSTAPAAAVAAVVALALAEDAPWGDVTSEALVPAGARTTAVLRSRARGVLAGLGAVVEAMEQAAALAGTGPVTTELLAADGDPIAPGDVLARLEGPARAVLRGERVALNLVQHLSGVATATAEHVALVAGTSARVVDTRKTTPGLRALERHAVRCGGGHNHRWSLSDAVLVKDNHLAVLDGAAPERGGGPSVTAALAAVRARVPHTAFVEVEVDRLDQLDAVLDAGVDGVLLDNFSIADLAAGVARVRERAPGVLVEASGGVRRDTIAAIAATGVDLISVGALTQASPALDVGLDVDAPGDGAAGPTRTRTGGDG